MQHEAAFNLDFHYVANSEDVDEMQQYAAFHQGLYCLLKLKQPSRTEKHHNLETSTHDPLKYNSGNHILFVLIFMGKYIRIQRVYLVYNKQKKSEYIYCLLI